MSHGDRYAQHLATLGETLAKSLESAGRMGLHLDAVVFHAGRSQVYHRDDHPIPFHTDFHFRRWVPPLSGPEHVVLARPGARPKVVRVRPKDYWYDTSPAPESYFEQYVDLVEVEQFSEVLGAFGSALRPSDRLAYVGPSAEAAGELGIAVEKVEPEALMAPLDWYRSYKTEHEIALTRVACEQAAKGHLAAREAFRSGASEREIHWRYLEASDHLEADLPYESIVAFDHKAAVLHYQHKRGRDDAPGRLFLLDAGAACEGYAADLTRTWLGDDVPDEMTEIVHGVDALERDLVAMVTPGRPYLEIHEEAHRGTARILSKVGVFKVDPEEAFDRGLTLPFLCHGVGHPLGLQVHDVAGHQAGPEGGIVPPPERYPFLRCTRIMEPGHLVTIEPGIYFVDLLLDPLRQAGDDALDWQLIDRLAPFGGVRIEDDVLCTEGEAEDLSRHLLEGPRD